MPNVLVEKEKLDILAAAISDKSGERLPMTLDKMVSAVDGIEEGSTPQLQTKTVQPSESYQLITPDDGFLLSSVNVGAVSSSYVGSNIPHRDADDVTVSGPTLTVLSGYYGWNFAKTVASGTAGTPTATKGSVSNHSVSVTPSVTNTTGYISGSTINGTAVTVSASELVSGSETITENDTYDVTNLAEIVVDVPSGGGSVTITDEANATGITCVITSGGEPTPSGIPIGVQLIDFTSITNNYAINSSGNAVAEQWYSVSDYTEIDPSMTFSYSGCYWFYIGFYDASKNVIRAMSMTSDGTQRPNDTNYCDGTLTPAKIPSNAKYVRITSTMNPDSTILSLIRTA